ncbi:MAG TPA: hypothetical protein VJG90_05595 [Candidatus Nanoarchaeia archaeon]|nr:hypothetical protein [Candidatus Nanoarchaeia archaeon]
MTVRTAWLILIILFLFTYQTVHASSTTTDDDTSSGTSSTENLPPKEDAPPQEEIPSPLMECQHQCEVNGKQCIYQGTAEPICSSEIPKCYEQCAINGNPTPPLPAPTNVPPPPSQPQESPELVECMHQCDMDAKKSCSSSGADVNQCNKDLWACWDQCAAESSQDESQVSEENQPIDYGDAPDPTFPSWKSSNGARHVNTEHEWLGIDVSKESDSRQVDADDKDDGITLSNLYSLHPCSQVMLPVIISVKSREDPVHTYSNNKPLYLNMLFDWDMNGRWQGAVDCGLIAQEHAVQNYPIDVSSWPAGMTTNTVLIPLISGPVTQYIWVRATLTYDQKVDLSWNGRGAFGFGETEDYGPSRFMEPPHHSLRPSTSDENSPSTPSPLETPTPELSLSEKSDESLSAEEKTLELPLPDSDEGLVEQPPAQPKTTMNAIIQAVTNFFSSLFGGIY